MTALGWRFAAHLPTAWLLQTLAFVAFNKVVLQASHLPSAAQLRLSNICTTAAVLPCFAYSKAEADQQTSNKAQSFHSA